MASSRMKGFFPEKKKLGLGLGISKPKKSSVVSVQAKGKAKSKAKASPLPPVDHQDDEGEKEEEVLRLFDMNMAYGPCVGMLRLDRWNRANAMGLHPPQQVLLYLHNKHSSSSLWDARV